MTNFIASPTPPAAGRLFVVATPIGNLEDITLRAIRTLREADLVLAEDTRHTRTLLAHHQIATRMAALHAHTPPPRIAELAAQLASGQTFALVTDAGTPLVSDPGAELVRAAIALGVPITPIPGASAPLAALVASGLGGASFEFVGFLARGGGKRRDQIAHVAKSTAAVVLFESPNRLVETLSDLAGAIGSRRVAVCRELTKLHEEVVRGTAAELASRFADGVRGEITVVVAGADAADAAPDAPDDEAVDAAIDRLFDDGLTVRDAADAIAESLGLPRRDAYQRVLARRRSRGDSED